MNKKKTGRKSKYNDTYNLRVEQLAKEGCNDKRICKALNISYDTFYRWLKEFPLFSESYKRGKAESDEYIGTKAEKSLAKLIEGYEYEETKTELIADPNDPNKPMIKKQVKTKKFVPPNLGAICYFLNNRKPDRWSNSDKEVLDEKVEIELTLED